MILNRATTNTTATSHHFSGLSRRMRLGALAVASGLALSVGALAASATGAAGASGTSGSSGTTGQTTFTFSGTVRGTLSTPDTACTEQTVTAKGATFVLMGALKGAPATKWTLQLYNPKAGTSKKFGQESGNGPNVTLIGEDSNGNENWNWTSSSKHGSITTSKTSGKVNITLGPYSSYRGHPGKGHVTVTGSWGCTS
ncbi:MAG TPA: hypothetical protein VGF51_10475 [Acidimicrobiales bacterium]|jgi:hypothetical protein